MGTANHDGASPTLAVVAALLGARKPDMLAKRVEQCSARIDLERSGRTVDLKVTSTGKLVADATGALPALLWRPWALAAVLRPQRLRR